MLSGYPKKQSWTKEIEKNLCDFRGWGDEKALGRWAALDCDRHTRGGKHLAHDRACLQITSKNIAADIQAQRFRKQIN